MQKEVPFIGGKGGSHNLIGGASQNASLIVAVAGKGNAGSSCNAVEKIEFESAKSTTIRARHNGRTKSVGAGEICVKADH